MTWYLEHVLKALTLQTGVVLLSILFITLSVCILLVNVTFLEPQHPLAWIIMFLFVCCMIVIWSIAFWGAYKEIRNGITTATVLWSVYVILWIGVVVWSFANARDKRFCIGSRCPDVLWLINDDWGHDPIENKQSTSFDLHGQEIKNNIKNKGQVPQYSKVMKYPNNDGGNIMVTAITARNNKTSRLENYKRNIPKSNTVPPTLSNVTADGHLKKLLEFKILHTDYIKRFCGSHSMSENRLGITLPIIISVVYAIISLFSWMILISYQHEMKSQTTVVPSTIQI